jgi:hypothetical protein
MESDFNWQEGHPSSASLMAALDGELSGQQGVAVGQHVSECPQCAARWQRLAQASERLAEFHCSAIDTPLPEFELRLPADKTGVSALDEIHAWFRRPQFLMPAVALAAMLIGLVLWTNSRDRVTTAPGPELRTINRSQGTKAETASKPTLPASRSNGDQPRAPQSQTARVRLPQRSPNRGPSLPTAPPRRMPEIVSKSITAQSPELFWVLPYSDPALTAEGAEMVRVDLPREAFLMAGVPLGNLPATDTKERIAADVLIGADGLPRAIRPARQRVPATVVSTQL